MEPTYYFIEIVTATMLSWLYNLMLELLTASEATRPILSISSTPRLWGPNMGPTKFSYTLQSGPNECRVPAVYAHFQYKYDDMKTIRLG